MSDGTVQATVGNIQTDYSVAWGFAESWKTLPNAAEDFRPPVPYWDNAQGIMRATALSESLAGQRVIASCYSLGLYAVPFLHHDLDETPLTVADVLRSVTSFNAVLRLHTPDACNSADAVRIVSRHAWTPISAGSLLDTHVRLEPQITGTEWYDGAETTADGIHIYGAGAALKNIGRSLRVWRPGGMFLSSSWAQVTCNLALTMFPKVNPCRLFSLDARARLDTTEKSIGMAQLQNSVTVDLDMATTTGIIRSVGLNGAGLSTPIACVETPVAGSVWVADEPTSDPEAVTLDVHQVYSIPALDPVVRAIGPDIQSSPLLTAQTNGTHDAPWAFWEPLDLTRKSGLLRGYRVGLYSTGLATHGNVKVQLWTDANGLPGAPIDGTQATSVFLGLTGPVYLDLDAGDPVYVNSSRYWLVITINQNTGASVNPPPLEWRTGTVIAAANIYRWSFAIMGSFDFVAVWPGLGGSNPAVPTATYPSVYALVE